MADHPSPRRPRRFDSIFKLLLQRTEWVRWWLDAFASLPEGTAARLTAWPTEWVSEDLTQGRSDKLFLAEGEDGRPQGLILLECQDRYRSDMGLRLQGYGWAALKSAEANGVGAAAGPQFWVHASVLHVGDHRWPDELGFLGTAELPGGDTVMVRCPVRVVDIHAFPDQDDGFGNPWECIIQLFRVSHALRETRSPEGLDRILKRIGHLMEVLRVLLPDDRDLRRQASASMWELLAYDLRELGHQLPQDIILEEAAMKYDTIAEGIKATMEHAKAAARAEGVAEGIAEGRAEEKTELLTGVCGHMFPEQAEEFRQFLTSHSQEAWPDVSELLSWDGTGDEFMAWLADGRPDIS